MQCISLSSWETGQGFKALLGYRPSFAPSGFIAFTQNYHPRQSPIELSDKEKREEYYYGLPSEPALVARSRSDRWVLLLGPYNRPKPKQLKNIGNYPLASLLPSIKDDFMKILDTYSIL